jgi:DNA-directed RNA polymerase specialized sigma24 family protein
MAKNPISNNIRKLRFFNNEMTQKELAQKVGVTRQVTRGEREAMLHDALLHLNPEYRQAITLVFFEGRSLRDAGKQMGGRSEDALRMMLRRAELKLKEILQHKAGEDFDDPPSVGPP